MSHQRILGPFNRVEGDLEVHIEVTQQRITQARVNAPLFRGYERILQGKDPLDALVYTPRICGICSISQSVAAAQAIAQAQGIQPTPNGLLATNLILACENLADHLSHFYLFFMPDFARDFYQHKPWFKTIQSRFKAQTGTASGDALPARAEFLNITGLLAGKWPHSLAIQPGGTTKALESQQHIHLHTLLQSFRTFLEHTLFGTTLEHIANLQTEDDLNSLIEHHPHADFSQFLNLAKDLKLNHLGRANDQFMSYGAYPQTQGHLFKAGIWQQTLSPLNPELITEDHHHSWLNTSSQPQHPYQGSTLAGTDESEGYSWCKAPRLDGKVMEVGAIARQMVNGHPLIHNLVQQHGANVHTRVIARLLELALVLPVMQQWSNQFCPKSAYCHTQNIPDDAQGSGLVEAARGSLGHWIKIKNGRLLNYQIIAPTTWNFSPRDTQQQAGALEQALQNTSFESDAQANILIQHIIRSFDPCMVCTVH